MRNADLVDILIVEDNPNDAELTIRALKKQNLIQQMYIAKDGEEALDFIFCRGDFTSRQHARLPKVVFLDLKLPKINGLEVLKEIKSDPKTKSLPVVVVSSSKEDPDITQAYASGANGYVVKPVDFTAFIQAISYAGLYWLTINETTV
ncbi:MAG TPA: response regulator [Prolixibacteraceae bacterium]|nr:response regulator [Prolixibacteraceae bacterium]